MAFDQGGFHLIRFRVPADDYKYPHLEMRSGTDNKAVAKEHFLWGVNRKDVRIESIEKIESPMEAADALAKLLSEVDPGYRTLSKAEWKLSVADVAKLKAENAAPVA